MSDDDEPEDAPSEPPLCQDCGACCFTDEEYHVDLAATDFARLTLEEMETWTVVMHSRVYLRSPGGRCIALGIRDGRWACTIYERRPDPCREYARGEAACWWSRSERLPAVRRLLPRAPEP